MAASSLCNFLSFLIPLHLFETKQQPTQLIPSSLSSDSFTPPTLSSSSTSFQSRRNRDAVLPLMAEEDSYSSKDLMSVIFPSLAYSNTLFFKSAYNVQVVVDEDESEESLLGRFRRKVFYSGVIQESKRRRFFETKQEERKRKAKEAAKRKSRENARRKAMAGVGWYRRRGSKKEPTPDKEEVKKSVKNDEEEDNWELPEGDLPY